MKFVKMNQWDDLWREKLPPNLTQSEADDINFAVKGGFITEEEGEAMTNDPKLARQFLNRISEGRE